MHMEHLTRGLPALASPQVIVAAGVALRLAAFALTEIPAALAKRPELAPPTTSFRSRMSLFQVETRGKLMVGQ